MALKIAEKAIYELLKGLAGGDVFMMRATDGHAGPFIVIQRVSSDRWRTINGPDGIAQASIQIDAYADAYYDAKTLGGDIEEILDGFQGTVSHGSESPQETVDINGITLQNDQDIVDETDKPLLYRSSGTYLVTYTQ